MGVVAGAGAAGDDTTGEANGEGDGARAAAPPQPTAARAAVSKPTRSTRRITIRLLRGIRDGSAGPELRPVGEADGSRPCSTCRATFVVEPVDFVAARSTCS